MVQNYENWRVVLFLSFLFFFGFRVFVDGNVRCNDLLTQVGFSNIKKGYEEDVQALNFEMKYH